MDGNDGLERLISAEQDERRRLALFLHDGAVQQLSGIALMLDGAMHSLEQGETDEARAILESALAQQRTTIRALRDLSFVLEPVVLRDQGFGAALRALADQVADSHELVCEINTERATAIGETASIALYTILRELVDQAVRRGPPTRIAIAVRQDSDGQLFASVADDADPERRMRALEQIEERVRQLHGTLEVAAMESGTELRVTLPAHTARR